MGFKLGNVGTAVKGLGKTIKSEAGDVAKAAKTAANSIAHGGNVAKELGRVAKEVGDSFMDVGAASIGWAEMAGLRYGVKKYQFEVSPQLTRGSRLEGSDMEALKAKGFKGVVNLCAENDADTAPAAKVGMRSLHLPIIDNTAPTEAQMKQFLDFVTNPANQPAYVHCEAGQGRTGVSVAVYRMAVQGWPVEKAIAEGKSFGLRLPEHQEFLRQFSADLAAGKIAGYPK
jgi:protein tyrosine phosphatase (PTP) superfamily phosphohydrolase (DUF442 family)